jgi:CheY-like chemotaxis protein
MSSGETSASGSGPVNPSVPRILVVDDDLLNQRVMVNLLKRKGWQGTVAASGDECLRKLAADPIDLVLLDIQMPQMDGFQTAALVRQQEAAGALPRRVPIVAITAMRLPDTRDRCLAVGMDEHLTKPVNTDELYGVIRRILNLPA